MIAGKHSDSNSPSETTSFINRVASRHLDQQMVLISHQHIAVHEEPRSLEDFT